MARPNVEFEYSATRPFTFLTIQSSVNEQNISTWGVVHAGEDSTMIGSTLYVHSGE